MQGTKGKSAHPDHSPKDISQRGQGLVSQGGGPRQPAGPQELPDRSVVVLGQRHFCVFAVSFPGQEALMTIYSTILTQHLSFRSVSMALQRVSNQLVASALGKLASLLLLPVGKTYSFMGLTVLHSPPPRINILFILWNQYF